VPKLSEDRGSGVVRYQWLLRLRNADLAKHGKHSLQGLRIASTNPLRLIAMSQESNHNLSVQIPDRNLFLFHPSAEIGDDDDLLSDGIVSVTLIGYNGHIGVEVFTQRPLA
jgi:hypothetical protein